MEENQTIFQFARESAITLQDLIPFGKTENGVTSAISLEDFKASIGVLGTEIPEYRGTISTSTVSLDFTQYRKLFTTTSLDTEISAVGDAFISGSIYTLVVKASGQDVTVSFGSGFNSSSIDITDGNSIGIQFIAESESQLVRIGVTTVVGGGGFTPLTQGRIIIAGSDGLPSGTNKLNFNEGDGQLSIGVIGVGGALADLAIKSQNIDAIRIIDASDEERIKLRPTGAIIIKAAVDRSTFITNNNLDGVVGIANTYIGFEVGKNTITGYKNTSVGAYSGELISSGEYNCFFGNDSGKKVTSGDNNSFFGAETGIENTANGNSFFGFESGKLNTTASGGCFFGAYSGNNNTTGTRNVFIGFSAGKVNTVGTLNLCIGAFSGFSNISGVNNTLVGQGSGQSNTLGDENIFVGSRAGFSNIDGSKNIVISSNIEGNGEYDLTSASSSQELRIADFLFGQNIYTIGQGNLGFNVQSGFGGGKGVISVKNAHTIPSSNPLDGIILYSNNNLLKYRTPSGTVITLDGVGGGGGTIPATVINDETGNPVTTVLFDKPMKYENCTGVIEIDFTGAANYKLTQILEHVGVGLQLGEGIEIVGDGKYNTDNVTKNYIFLNYLDGENRVLAVVNPDTTPVDATNVLISGGGEDELMTISFDKPENESNSKYFIQSADDNLFSVNESIVQSGYELNTFTPDNSYLNKFVRGGVIQSISENGIASLSKNIIWSSYKQIGAASISDTIYLTDVFDFSGQNVSGVNLISGTTSSKSALDVSGSVDGNALLMQSEFAGGVGDKVAAFFDSPDVAGAYKIEMFSRASTTNNPSDLNYFTNGGYKGELINSQGTTNITFDYDNQGVTLSTSFGINGTYWGIVKSSVNVNLDATNNQLNLFHDSNDWSGIDFIKITKI